MQPAFKTIAAINAHFVAKDEEPFRAHLGASVIGDECARRIWYQYRWTKAEKFEGRMLRLFNRGHLEEFRFVEWLRAIGVKIWETNPETGKQWRITDHDGHFGGSLDAVGLGLPDLPPHTPFLCEFKTHNDKSFKKLQSDGLMRTKWKHFVQMQVYMQKMDLTHAVYFAINKNDDDLFTEIIERDPREADRAIERAGMIIKAETPPERVAKTPSHFTCKFCHLQRLCHFGDVIPERNCRTCVFASPDKDGFWHCGYVKGPYEHGLLDEAAQRAGCEAYTVNPVLLGRQP